MSIKFEFEKHHVAFPSKIESALAGRHFNIVVTEPTDNGTIVGKGAYVSFDQYEKADCPATYEGEILEQAADGTWYVEVKHTDINNPAIFIYVPEDDKYSNYDSRFRDLANFYTDASPEKPAVVHGYLLTTTDVYAISESAFTGTPAPGKKVTVTGQMHVVEV